MKQKILHPGLIPALFISLAMIASTAQGQPKNKARWYKFQHISVGAKVFQANCATCHGKKGEGAVNWRQIGVDEKMPPPPLNGTGHAWHHPLQILYNVIKKGSPGGQGNMPPWQGKLSDEEILAAIAWFQSKWPDEIYQHWLEREKTYRQRQQKKP